MKKLLVTTLAMCIAISTVFTGCSKDSDVKEDAVVDKTQISAKGEFPIVKDKLTLKCFAMKPPMVENLETNLFTKELEEKTNIHIEWQTTTSDGLKEKRNLMFSSGVYPDIMLSAGITAEEQMLYGSQKVLLPLNDLLDEHCVEFPKLMNDIEWLRPAITTPDNNIYSLPQINECYHCTMAQKLWINRTWLDNLNLKMPTTTDEFEKVLLAFKNDDPNGNGKADEIPLSGAITGWQTGVADFLMNAFIYNDGTTEGHRVRMNNDKVEFVANKPEFKEGLKWLKKLYDEGLIDAAAFTQPSDQFKQLGVNEPDAILGAGTAGSVSAFTKIGSDRSMMYEALAPLKGPNGVQTTYHNPYGYVQGSFAITNANKHPIESIKWIDYLYSEAGTRRANEGREGTEWVKPEEGVIGINGEQAEWTRKVSFDDVQNITWIGMDIGAVTSHYRLSEVAGDPSKAEGFESRLYNETSEKYEPYKEKNILPPLYMSVDDIDDMAQINEPLSSYVKQCMAKFITGAMDIDSDWDEYEKGLKGLKLDRYIGILQNSYDNSAFINK